MSEPSKSDKKSSAEAFKAAGLKSRVITAVIATVAFLATIFLSNLFYFQLIIGLVFVLAAWEWADLSDCGAKPVRTVYAGLMGLCLYLLSNEFFAGSETSLQVFTQLMLSTAAFWLLVLLLVLTYPRTAKLWGSRQIRILMGFLVLLPTWSGLVFLKYQDPSGWLIVWLIAIVAMADIGAYFVGVRFGKHKLAPKVSPGKSWEGVAGGVVANIFFAGLLAYWLQATLIESAVLIFAMSCVGVFSILGDLFESMVKRHRGVKDSGILLPGHGGILDRIDGWTIAVPVFVLIYLFGVVYY